MSKHFQWLTKITAATSYYNEYCCCPRCSAKLIIFWAIVLHFQYLRDLLCTKIRIFTFLFILIICVLLKCHIYSLSSPLPLLDLPTPYLNPSITLAGFLLPPDACTCIPLSPTTMHSYHCHPTTTPPLSPTTSPTTVTHHHHSYHCHPPPPLLPLSPPPLLPLPPTTTTPTTVTHHHSTIATHHHSTTQAGWDSHAIITSHGCGSHITNYVHSIHFEQAKLIF